MQWEWDPAVLRAMGLPTQFVSKRMKQAKQKKREKRRDKGSYHAPDVFVHDAAAQSRFDRLQQEEHSGMVQYALPRWFNSYGFPIWEEDTAPNVHAYFIEDEGEDGPQVRWKNPVPLAAAHDHNEETEHPVPDALQKYWNQRYRLFERFDEGIQMDQEGWYSATPEFIAKHIAERCACGVLVDAFCGVGGNTIQFAQVCERVIAIDVCPERLAMAKHNCQVYGVADRVEFILGDCFMILPHLRADVVYLGPPWGGPSYTDTDTFHLRDFSLDIAHLHRLVTKHVTGEVAYCLPKNVCVDDIVALAGPGVPCELERNHMNYKLKMITAYFGSLVNV